MTNFTVGDKVEVSYRGEVTAVREDRIFVDVEGKPGNSVDVRYRDVIGANPDGGSLNVTVTEKAVEKFGPGSVVRHRLRGYVYTILEDGFFVHSSDGVSHIHVDFTSENYERLA